MNELPSVSVVIPAYNEELNLPQTLADLKLQDYSGPVEIIVSNNNSTDRTAEIAAENGAVVVTEMQKGTRFAYDRGMRESHGELILVTNSDTRLPRNWISRIVAEYADPEVVGVGTRVKFYDVPKWINVFLDLTNNKLNFKPAMWGVSLSCRRWVYDKVGGFNHGVNTNEDAIFTLLIEKFGKVKILKDVVVEMDGRRFNKGFFPAVKEWLKGYGVNGLYIQINYMITGEIKALINDFGDHRSITFGKGEEAQIAVVIPTGNHQKQIANVLTTLQEQEFGFRYRIYVLDNFCIDQSLNIAKLFNFVTIARYPSLYTFGQKLARLVNDIPEPVIVFTTPEADLPTDWLKTVYQHFDKHKQIILSGPYINYNSTLVTKVTKQPLENLTNKLEFNNMAVSNEQAKKLFTTKGDYQSTVEQIRKQVSEQDIEIQYDSDFKSYYNGDNALLSSTNVIRNTLRKLANL